MHDNNYIIKNGKNNEEKIINLKEIITLLSQKLQMNLEYIDIESIIIEKDKESIKYFLILFINILYINKKHKQNIINKHFNNDIELLNRSCITERDEKDNNKNSIIKMNISLDAKLLADKNNKQFNTDNNINSKFNKFLKNIQKNINNNIKQINKNYDEKRTNLKIFYIPPIKQQNLDQKLNNKIKLYSSADKKDKKYFHIYLTQKELIYEVVKIIKNSISSEEFYDFLTSNNFAPKMMNMIEKIYELHFIRHKNIFISKHYLKDNEIDINSIILRELNLYKKYHKMKNNKKSNDNKIIKSNRNVEELSKLFKNIPWIRKFHEFNCIRTKHEIKETKINYEFKRKNNFKYINDFQKLFLKLINKEKNRNLEEKELEKLIYNIKYYQALEQKVDIKNNLKNHNKELKLLKKYNLLI